MINLDVDLLRRCLLAGSGGEAIGALLRDTKVEDLVLHLSHMNDDCFCGDDEDDISTVSIVDDRYVGTLLVRVLYVVLDKCRLEALFKNPQVLDLLSQRVVTGSLPVRRLFARKCRLYFQQYGGSDERLEEVLWELLFDSDYIVFECCSQAICAVAQQRDVLTTDRINTLVAKLHSADDPYCVLPVRLFEFCVSLGRCSPVAFRSLLDAGVYRALFGLYMSSDFLVKLNCLEILASSPEVLMQLQESGHIPQEFVDHALSVFASVSSGSSDDEFLVPFLFRICVSLLKSGCLSSSERASFSGFVCHVIMSTSVHKADASFCTSLVCFGTLYLLGFMPEEVCHRLDEIVSSTTQEDVLSAILDSLMCITEGGITDGQVEFLVAISGSVVKALARFAMSEVREQAYVYLLKALRFDAILLLLLNEDSSSHVLSSQENQYATTVAKKNLVREVLRRVEAVDGDSPAALSEERLKALKRYTTQG